MFAERDMYGTTLTRVEEKHRVILPTWTGVEKHEKVAIVKDFDLDFLKIMSTRDANRVLAQLQKQNIELWQKAFENLSFNKIDLNNRVTIGSKRIPNEINIKVVGARRSIYLLTEEQVEKVRQHRKPPTLEPDEILENKIHKTDYKGRIHLSKTGSLELKDTVLSIPYLENGLLQLGKSEDLDICLKIKELEEQINNTSNKEERINLKYKLLALAELILKPESISSGNRLVLDQDYISPGREYRIVQARKSIYIFLDSPTKTLS